VSRKRTVWVLDTATKGTGAEMVPLDRLERERQRRPEGPRERIRVLSPPDPDAPAETSPEPEERRVARRFRIVDVRSRQVLADDVGLASALATLRGVGSVVDVNVHVWDSEEQDWRPLTLAERKTLWGFRDQ